MFFLFTVNVSPDLSKTSVGDTVLTSLFGHSCKKFCPNAFPSHRKKIHSRFLDNVVSFGPPISALTRSSQDVRLSSFDEMQ